MDHREFPVLYVDDEPDNLRIFDISFRREFSVLTAQSAEEGLRLLNENPVAVVLSDQRMPGVTGVEFLSRVRELDSSTIRILVTAYGDAAILGEAINDGSIYRYIPKPWDPNDMRLTVRRAIEMYALERERGALLEELTQLNRLSRSLHREIDFDRLVEVLLRAMTHDLGFDGASLLLFDGNEERLSWAGIAPDGTGVAQKLRAIDIHMGSAPDFIESLLAGNARALRVEDLSELEAPVRSWVAEVSADEILVAPLVGKTSVVGAIAVDNRAGGRRFGADDRTLLDGLSMQAVIAIENARLVQDLRASRAQVLRADRLGTLGTLAAGLAHEINNPLVSIHTFLSLAPEKRSEDDPAFWHEYHDLASAELDRIRGLVSTMSRLARGGTDPTAATRASFSLDEVAREIVGLIGREVTAGGVDLQLDVKGDAPKLVGVREHIHQVILNLVLNAVHATPAEGSVRLSVQADPDAPSERAEVIVSDTGVGIPDEYLERIFDPFFTTKDPDEGTGLGLMIAHQIVADHGGTIEVRSRPGEGATFTLRLPASGRQASKAE